MSETSLSRHLESTSEGATGEVIEFRLRRQARELDDAEAVVLANSLRNGELVEDVLVDRIYEGRWREPSEVHWTATQVIQRVVQLLALREGETVLDVGSGVGKFCLVGALASAARFVGVEQRRSLVEVALRAQRRLTVDRVEFLWGNALDLDWSAFTCIYLFNPFEEHLMPAGSRVDNSMPFSEAGYLASIEAARTKLEKLPVGARVVSFWGYGGERPDSFALLHHERHGDGDLEVGRKRG
jgi:hypothetical protein